MRKYLAIAAAIAAFGSVVAIGTASAQQPEVTPAQHIVTVTKDVEGAVPDEATFVVEVECGAQDYDLTFDEDGGTKSVTVGDSSGGPQTCTIEEGNDGGASDTEISGSPCEFTGKETVDTVCDVTVENSFDEVTTTTAPPAPPVIGEQPAIGSAPVIVASPALTG